MLIPEVQTHVHKREEKKKLRAPPRRTSALFGFSIWQKGSYSENLAGLPGISWGRSDQDFGKARLPVAGSSAREVELGRTGLSATLAFEKKTRFDMFHVFPSCEPAPHGAQMQIDV